MISFVNNELNPIGTKRIFQYDYDVELSLTSTKETTDAR
ncbi:hypothetical protein V144x_32170 [Gimesia aquarii]|uniref:Uncharacterized protein n=1 Tax=Gimesia aquarii TaxID=2527964 RepID=A0A517VXK6_9PLAN|nr:hypothetical protein V144x_32170 [Gimesia aquarii]